MSGRHPTLRLAVTGAAVLLAAADTYVVVLALPAMMSDAGISLDRLQQATPIVTGFLLGYIAVMPLIGRVSDVYGRTPVFVACLCVFGFGSVVTASAHSLPVMVAGRALQGLGGGGLVPVTLALVADLWPVERRGVPLGIVGALQELGAVIGPLYGAAILTAGGWRTIFWINVPLSLVLAAALLWLRAGATGERRAGQPSNGSSAGAAQRTGAGVAGSAHLDGIGIALLGLMLIALLLVLLAPDALVSSASVGTLYAPLSGVAWLTPLALIGVAALLLFVLWELLAPPSVRVLVPPGSIRSLAQRVDWLGSLLLAGVLAVIVVAFSSVDPQRQALSDLAPWLLPAAALLGLLFVLRERATPDPLVDLPEFRSRQAVGALLVNLATGAALITVLVDVPILARVTVSPDSQLGAAAVLLRLLAAVPVGALLGGALWQRVGSRIITTMGLVLVAAMLALMARWTPTTLQDPLGTSWLHASDPVLVAAGLGFGLVIAPVNAAMLGAVRAAVHGLASALVVVARMIGMLIGLSILTAVGLHVFFAGQQHIPSPQVLCPRTPLSCSAYDQLVKVAIVDELRVVFLGAAVCAALGAVTGLATLADQRPGRLPLPSAA